MARVDDSPNCTVRGTGDTIETLGFIDVDTEIVKAVKGESSCGMVATATAGGCPHRATNAAAEVERIAAQRCDG